MSLIECMKNSTILFIIALFSFQSIAQTTFIDTRDGNIYGTFTFNDITWMTSNLKYLSSNSYCKILKPKDEICEAYNFYPKQDLGNVCPDGWRMPLSEDWDEFWAWYYKQRIIKHANIKLDTIAIHSQETFFKDESRTLNLFAKENPLQFSSSDWIQGKRRIERGNMNMWISKGKDNFHTHMGPVGLVKHEHKHHIEDKKRRVRQFVVRCVKDKQE